LNLFQVLIFYNLICKNKYFIFISFFFFFFFFFISLGYGSSAVVYIANYKPLNKNVAIKMIDLDQFERNQIDELRVR